jgi:hypothetical protein
VHPQTALGRSIFVFWALIGVGSMTILIAVVCDALSNKYHSVIHSKSFDDAVERYRTKHAQRNRPQGPHGVTHNLKSDIAELASSSGAHGEKPSTIQLQPNGGQNEKASGSKKAGDGERVDGDMQVPLEALPPLILEEAQTLRAGLHYFLATNGHAPNWSDAAGDSDVPDSLVRLRDEITQGGNLTERMKVEIWDDESARNVRPASLSPLGMSFGLARALTALNRRRYLCLASRRASGALSIQPSVRSRPLHSAIASLRSTSRSRAPDRTRRARPGLRRSCRAEGTLRESAAVLVLVAVRLHLEAIWSRAHIHESA